MAAERVGLLKNPCVDCEARDYQVEEYLLEEVKMVFRGEKPETEIASYEVNLEDGSWRCLMPEEIEIKKENFSVSERQWSIAARVVLLRLGHNFNVLHEKYEEDLKRRRKTTTEKTVYPIEQLSGELSGLVSEGQFEIVLAGTVAQNKKGWQILVRKAE